MQMQQSLLALLLYYLLLLQLLGRAFTLTTQMLNTIKATLLLRINSSPVAKDFIEFGRRRQDLLRRVVVVTDLRSFQTLAKNFGTNTFGLWVVNFTKNKALQFEQLLKPSRGRYTA